MNKNEWFDNVIYLFDLEAYEEIRMACDEAIKIDPKNIEAWIVKGIALSKLGENEEVQRVFDKAIKIDPKNIEAWIVKGIALSKLGKKEEAQEALDNAFEIDPIDADALIAEAVALGKTWKEVKAQEVFDKVVETDPKNIKAWIACAIELLQLKEYKKALEACDNIIKIDLQNTEVQRLRNIAKSCLLKQHEWQKFHSVEILESEKPFVEVPVFYATDRNRTNSSRPSEFFGKEPSDYVNYGICKVSISKDHKIGKLEYPSLLRLQFHEDPKKHVILLDVIPKEKELYFTELENKIRNSSSKKTFIFVHGYCVSFEDAARRTAQIAYDIDKEISITPVFYSWPSQGTLRGYPIDENNSDWTWKNLKMFLDDFITQTDTENIYLIAHSMGNRPLARAFGSLISDNANLRERFREVILMAPDIDAKIFKRDIALQIAPKAGTKTYVTLYASSNDKALSMSKMYHGDQRAGSSYPKPIVAEGIETIDVVNVDTSLIGHSYYARIRAVVDDIFHIIHNSKRPDDRYGLEAVNIGTERYWKFRK